MFAGIGALLVARSQYLKVYDSVSDAKANLAEKLSRRFTDPSFSTTEAKGLQCGAVRSSKKLALNSRSKADHLPVASRLVWTLNI